MTAKRFWMLFTLAGALMFVVGLVLTIVLVIETGEEQPESACSTMGAAVPAYKCITSDDPKVLLGVAPLMLGIGMAVWGGIKWASAAASDRLGDSSDPNSLMGSIQALQEQAMGMAPNAPPPGSTPPAPPPGGPPIKS